MLESSTRLRNGVTLDAEIFYFSGTGNSLVAAKGLSERTNSKLVPIVAQMGKARIPVRADVIGIVFPVYYADVPPLVKKFLGKLESIQGKYVFSVCTYGGGIGDSVHTIRRIIRSRSGELSAAFGLHMPQNAFHKPWESRQRIYRRSRNKLDIISKSILLKRSGMLFSDRLWGSILLPIHRAIRPMYKNSLKKLVGTEENLQVDELIHLLDKSFRINEKCTGCGICAKICPVENIRLVNNHPVWLKHCENCLACYNWCPEQAIQNDVAQNGYRYRHPDVKTIDIMKQKVSEE